MGEQRSHRQWIAWIVISLVLGALACNAPRSTVNVTPTRSIADILTNVTPVTLTPNVTTTEEAAETATPEAQTLSTHALSISTGGAAVTLICDEETVLFSEQKEEQVSL